MGKCLPVRNTKPALQQRLVNIRANDTVLIQILTVIQAVILNLHLMVMTQSMSSVSCVTNLKVRFYGYNWPDLLSLGKL